jgi:hypothetical protein
VVPARSLPSLRARLARVRGIPLLEATPTCAEGGDKDARARLGYEASTSCELDGEIEIARAGSERAARPRCRRLLGSRPTSLRTPSRRASGEARSGRAWAKEAARRCHAVEAYAGD